MSGYLFEWDHNKAISNVRKHKVSFAEAKTIFDDPAHKHEYDDKHAGPEDRWLAIGFSQRLRLLTVVYTKRHETIRIISARRATEAESRRYSEQQ